MRAQHIVGWVAFLCLAGGSAATAIADDHHRDSKFERKIVLLATTNAPTGATGKAKLEADIKDGVSSARLEIKTKGLLTGSYGVSVTDTTGTNTFALGTFDVAAKSDKVDAAYDNHGDGDFPLPASLQPTDVVRVSITDSNAVLDLTGVFPSLTYDFKVKTALTATTNAPAKAAGKAELDADNKYGVVSARLKVEATGLLPGAYSVSLTDIAGSNTFELGMLNVPNWHRPKSHAKGGPHHEDNGKEPSKAEFGLPAGLDPLDAAGISISNSNSLPVLVGDFTNTTHMVSGHFKTTTGLTPGPSYPDVHGAASLSVEINKAKSRSKLHLVAQGVPPNETLTLLVNGVATQTIRSHGDGQIAIMHLRKVDLTDLKSLAAQDAHGQVVFSVSF